jgi:hypothetical protein
VAGYCEHSNEFLRCIKCGGHIRLSSWLLTVQDVQQSATALNTFLYLSSQLSDPPYKRARSLVSRGFAVHNNASPLDMCPYSRSRDSSVGIATGYGLDGRGVEVQVLVGSRIFSSPRGRDRLWCPPNLLSDVYRGLFLRR